MGAFDEPADRLDRDLGIGPSEQEAVSSGPPAPDAAERPTLPIAPGATPPSFLAGRSRIGQPVGSRPLSPAVYHDALEGRLSPMSQPVDPRLAALAEDAGQHARPAPATSQIGRQARPVPRGREQDSPEWSQPRRHEAYPTLTTRMGLRGVPPVLLAAVGLALAALVLYLVPGFLAGGDPATPTSRPSQAAVVTPTPRPTPSPTPTPQVYTVVSGDNMLRIARMFGLTVEQVACFNDIEDINRLQVGQELLIPEDDFVCPGGESQPPAGEETEGSGATEEP